VSVSVSSPGDGASDVVVVVSSKGMHKVEQNYTKKQKTKNKKKNLKVSQVQMQYSFSKFFSMQV
jgi:hypothetical protein